MQEIDGKTRQDVRYAPRCRSVRRIYLGRITAVVSAICFAVIAGLFLHSYKTQTAAVEKEYSAALSQYVCSLSEAITDVSMQFERAEISESLAVLKIRKLYRAAERQTRKGREISDICAAFALFFERAETDGAKSALYELSRGIDAISERMT